MGCDIHTFIEIESPTPGEYDSLCEPQLHLPRHYRLFSALAGVRGDLKPLYPPRGLPAGLSAHGFERCYRQVIPHTKALDYRRQNFVLPYEVGRATVLPASISSRWGISELGYVANDHMEVPSWLTLAEFNAAIAYAGLHGETLPPEYQFIIDTMGAAERIFGRHTRLVFWFNDV